MCERSRQGSPRSPPRSSRSRTRLGSCSDMSPSLREQPKTALLAPLTSLGTPHSGGAHTRGPGSEPRPRACLCFWTAAWSSAPQQPRSCLPWSRCQPPGHPQLLPPPGDGRVTTGPQPRARPVCTAPPAPGCGPAGSAPGVRGFPAGGASEPPPPGRPPSGWPLPSETPRGGLPGARWALTSPALGHSLQSLSMTCPTRRCVSPQRVGGHGFLKMTQRTTKSPGTFRSGKSAGHTKAAAASFRRVRFLASASAWRQKAGRLPPGATRRRGPHFAEERVLEVGCTIM